MSFKHILAALAMVLLSSCALAETIIGTSSSANNNTYVIRTPAGAVAAKSVTMSIVSKNADYTATASDYTIIVDASAAPVTITLPAATGATGQVLNIKKIDNANNVTVSSASSIDGGSLTISTQYGAYQVQSDGSTWHVLAKN